MDEEREQHGINQEETTEIKVDPAAKTIEKYVDLMDNTINNSNSKEKSAYLKMTQKYVLDNSYIIQKYMDNLSVKDKVKVVSKLKKFKEEEIEDKIKAEKFFTRMTISISIVLFIITCIVGIIKGDQLLILGSIVAIGFISVIILTIEDYIYDIASYKKELSGLDNWLSGLKEEEDVLKENNYLKQELEYNAKDFEEAKKQYKELQQKNKQLESEVIRLQEKIEEYKVEYKIDRKR